MPFGEDFAVAIRESGWRKCDVAKHFKVSRQTIRAWEIGEALPDSTHQKAIAKFMGVELRLIVAQVNEEQAQRRKLSAAEKARPRYYTPRPAPKPDVEMP